MKSQLTEVQKVAVAVHAECLRQEFLMLETPFTNGDAMYLVMLKTDKARQECKSLGLTHEDWL